ncbi:MAG: PQQ-binding-like beta-propeller repeat protein [Pirellulales bacterium]
MTNQPSGESAPPAAPAAASSRPILPIAIVAAETIALAGLQYAQDAEWLSPANAFLAKFSTAGAALIALVLWFVFFAPLARTTRRRVGVAALLLVGLALLALRVESVTGDIFPRLRFRWAPHADETLGKVATETGGAPVDLASTSSTDYPQYLGANRLATLSGVNLARNWSEHAPTQLWRHPIGAGWSSFAVVGPFAVTQEQRGDEELITCYEVDTGKARWVHSTPVRFQETLAGIGPRATPTIHQGKVYVMGALGHLTCLDGATGKQLWQHDVLTEFDAAERTPKWGKSCSPLVYEDLVIVSAGGDKGKSLVAFDAATGALRWTGGDDYSSYSSPVAMTLCGVPQIVIVNARCVAAHDPATGAVLWVRSWPERALEAGNVEPTVAQPVAVGDDRILLTKGYGTGSALWQVKHDSDQWTVDELWRGTAMKTKFTNPVIRDGHAYGLDEGILECIDLASGRKTWKRGKYGHGQVLLVDDLLLVQSEAGELALVEANPKEFKELARFQAIAGTAWNPPALSGRKLLLRSEQEAACYELPAASP